MSEMVERVAKALAGWDWDSCPNDHDRWRSDARAAIEAMREPTQPMRDAAFRRGGVNSTQSYKAAILAALEDKA